MMNFLKNDEGVSPIVATLVLIVVAIIGAAAVAMILGNFSGSVSNQVDSSSNVTNSVASPHTISIAGSTTVYPAEVLLAKDYHAKNPLITINVAQGGSDAGINAVGMNLVDIGASSRAVTTGANSDMSKYPNLQAQKVGGSAVVVIAHSIGAGVTGVTKAELQTVWSETASPVLAGNVTGVTMAVHRADGSGTEDTFAKYLKSSSTSAFSSGSLANAYYAGTVTPDAEVGNEGVLAKVGSTTGSIGFVDWGYVASGAPAGVTILTVNDKTANSGNIKAALKDSTSTAYEQGLLKNLYFVTNGAPSQSVQDFITYAASPAGAASFDKAGMFGITEFA